MIPTENILPFRKEANGKSENEKRVHDRVVKLAMLSDPPLSYSVIAFVVRADFPNAATSAKSVASTLSTLPADLKSKLPPNRPRSRRMASS